MFTKNQTLSTDLSTAIPQERSVFAIFVHFGLSETTNAAVSSIIGGSIRPDHIIVVDHAETVFRSTLPLVVIRPEDNTGYAGGLRAGMHQARVLGAKEHDLCILLNNDVVLSGTSLKTILAWWQVHGRSNVVAGAMGGYVSLLSGRAKIALKRKEATSWSVPYVHGSCVIGELGFLSSLEIPTHFFLYWEDVALSMIAQKRGGLLAAIPTLQLSHNDALSPVSLSKLFYLVRNGAYVLEHYASLPWRVYWYTVNTIRMAYHSLMSGIQHELVARALYDARSGRLGKVDI